MRILTGGVMHETSTFATDVTTLANFEAGKGILRGQAMLDVFRGANFCGGGFLEGAERHGFELAPILWTFATPSGLIERAAYEALKAEFLAGVEREKLNGFDGILLDMHGAMVVDGIDEADADFIAAVRAAAGPDVPLVVTTDLHANHTAERLAACDAIVGYDTYPHIDMAERGSEAADLIVRMIRGEVRPTASFRSLPLIWSAECQVTAHMPMLEVMERIFEIERRPGILTATMSTGFPWADVPNMGASVIVVADGDRELAQRTADEIGDWIWENRSRWYVAPMKLGEALAECEKSGRSPIVLADMADNTGGGAPGDSSHVLREFVARDLQGALVLYMVDPETAAQAHAAGVGTTIHALVGGKSDPRQGAPVEMEAEVVALSNGRFRYDGPMYSGSDGDLGPSAWLRQRGVSVLVTSVRMQPLDLAFCRSLGIDCASMRYIAVKSAVHFRSGFEKLGGPIYNIDAPAVHSHDYTTLDYRRRQPVYPLDIK